MKLTVEVLRAKLDELDQSDPQRQLFGAPQHQYQLAAPLTEAAVAQFEAENNVRLPDEYRQFLVAAGNGGAGPVYGLKPLAAWRPPAFVRVTSVVTTDDGQRFEAGTAERPSLSRPADPARPFALSAAWGPPAADGSNFPDDLPDGASPYDGCVELAEIGCGYFYFLVVTGPHAGEVWQDHTAGDGQISPTGTSFFGWYDAWLDESLAECGHAQLSLALKSGQKSPLLDRHAARVEAHARASPEWAAGHLRLAAVHGYRGEFAQAEVELARAVEAEPGLKLDAALLGVGLLWQQNRLADLVERATAVLGSGDFHFMIFKELHEVRVLALRLLGRIDEALAASQQRMDLDGHNLWGWLEHAELQVLNGDRTGAEKSLRDAAAKSAGDSDSSQLARQGWSALADRLDAQGRHDDGAHFRALATSPSA